MLCAILLKTEKLRTSFFTLTCERPLPMQGVEYPVTAILNAPALTDQALEGLRAGIETTGVEPTLAGGLLVNHHKILQLLPFFADRRLHPVETAGNGHPPRANMPIVFFGLLVKAPCFALLVDD